VGPAGLEPTTSTVKFRRFGDVAEVFEFPGIVRPERSVDHLAIVSPIRKDAI